MLFWLGSRVRVKLSQMKMDYYERNNSEIESLGSKTVALLSIATGHKVSNVTVMQLKPACNENLTVHMGGHCSMSPLLN